MKNALLWLLNLQVITWTKWEIVRILKLNIISCGHVTGKADSNIRKVNVMIVTLKKANRISGDLILKL